MGFKFLFVPLMQRGHTQQIVGIIQQLQNDGHSVAVFGSPRRDIEAQFKSAGVECRWLPEKDDQSLLDPSRVKLGSRVRDLRWYKQWYSFAVTNNLTEKRVADVRAAIREFEPAVVCADALSYDAGVAATLEHTPLAVLSMLMMTASSPSWHFPFKDIAEDAREETLRRMASLQAPDVQLESTDLVSPWLNILFSTEELLPRSLSGNARSWFVGMSRPLGRRGDEAPFPWDKLRDEVPVVYVSSGGGHALSYDPETYRTITSSLGPDEAQFVCSMGEVVDHPIVRELPSHVIAVRYAPQVAILERRAAVAVSHGGINSVNEALYHGRPMLIMPMAHDQPLQARAIEHAGAGLALDLDGLSVEECREALLRLLREDSFREAAGRIRTSYRRQNGAVVAAELLCRLARDGKPLVPPPSDFPPADSGA